MDPSFAGFELDPYKCRNPSIQRKRELVRELMNRPESALEELQIWSRRDLLEILCIELGKERKYTGLTKQKLIENIFRIVSEKKSGDHAKYTGSTLRSPTESQTSTKRQRKNDHPSRLLIAENIPSESCKLEASKNTRFCLNIACRASLNIEDSFCKRCSCCICQKYDDNKDPSLWLFCGSGPLAQSDSCGRSCHLDCAMKDERTGITKTGQNTELDGSYYCTHCGRLNDLLGCWRKQLIVAKDARRVDVLCHRVSISHKLLSSTMKYQRLHEIVDAAMKKLEDEIGPFSNITSMVRGIVNRLSVGAEVQRLCAQAVEMLDFMVSSASSIQQFQQAITKFEESPSSSVTLLFDLEDVCPFLSPDLIGYTFWHRKVNARDYPADPTSTLYMPNRRFLVSGLIPRTKYIFKVVAFSNKRDIGMWEVGVTTESANKNVSMSSVVERMLLPTNNSVPSNHTSEVDESHNNSAFADLNKSPSSYFGDGEKLDVIESEIFVDQINNSKGTEHEEILDLSGSASEDPGDQKLETKSNAQAGYAMVIAPSLPTIPSMLETGSEKSSITLLLENGTAKPERELGSKSKKKNEICKQDGHMEGDYEYCVKVIRWLECKGHVESSFRVKFLTWFSLRASVQERRIVSVFIDTLIDDPGSLAGQLVDSFSDAIYSKRPPPVPTGFCTRLWHK